jgi:formylglycine-generating enzyme required for sulfatase activity
VSARSRRAAVAVAVAVAAAALALASCAAIDVQLPGRSSCPARGGAMVRVDGRFCIDETEVTREHYAAWLATRPPTAGQPRSCAWNEDFTPRCEWPAADKAGGPVVCVDWCDAAAYCRAVGKRLCGRVGGGASAYAQWRAPSSEWMSACARAGLEHDGARCNGWKRGARKTLASRRDAECRGPDGARDLLGNVWEWEDSCDADAGARDHCRVRGGSFLSTDEHLSCQEPGQQARDGTQDDVGFRCCAD